MSSRRGLGPWIEFALATPIVLWCGWPFFQRGWASVENPQPEHVHADRHGRRRGLLYSAVATIAPRHLSAIRSHGMGGQPEVYFEAAAAIIALVLLGQVLELRARSRTGSAIRALLDLSPKMARIMRDDGTEYDVPLDQVRSATCCACGPAKRFRWTASCSTASAPWTNR